MVLYTIGHSNHQIDQFIQLLLDHEIVCLVDVRTTPYSRFHNQFNKDALRQSLQKQEIEYVYLGVELGGRPRDPSCYRHNTIPSKPNDYLHEVNYAEVMKRPWFIQGIQRLLELAGGHSTVIMCGEADPTYCHRHHLIASYLLASHPEMTMLHIRKDGSLIDASSIPVMTDKPGTEQLSF